MSAPVYDRIFSQDITQKVETRHGGGLVFNGNNGSMTLGVRLFNGGEPLAPSGSVTGQVVIFGTVVVAVNAAVDSDEPVFSERYGIGEHTAFVALCGHEKAVCHIIAEVFIDFSELLGRGFLRRFFNSVFICNGIAVVDVVVTGNNKNLNARIFFEFFELCGKNFVAFKFAVLGHIARNKKICFRTVCVSSYSVESVINKRIKLVIFLVFIINKGKTEYVKKY